MKNKNEVRNRETPGEKHTATRSYLSSRSSVELPSPVAHDAIEDAGSGNIDNDETEVYGPTDAHMRWPEGSPHLLSCFLVGDGRPLPLASWPPSVAASCTHSEPDLCTSYFVLLVVDGAHLYLHLCTLYPSDSQTETDICSSSES